MDYFHASLNALSGLFGLHALIGLAIGIAWGLLVSFMPGVGGNVAIALLLPFIFRLQVPEAIALLLGTHIATYFGGSITSITMNIPASAKSVSLCWDGYPLARRGKGALAIGASATASTLGGIAGAIVLTIGIPVMKNLLNVISNPEILMLAIWGLVIIAIFSSGDLLKGLMAGGLGMLLSWVGESPITGIDRLTFGSQYLSYGITFASAAMGLFAIAQAIRLLVERDKGSADGAGTASRPGVDTSTPRRAMDIERASNTTWNGAIAVLRRWKLTLYMATFGVFTGAIPGLGAPVAAIAAYGQAAQISKGDEFGTGAVEGVIAPQATEAASEGGGMLPMLTLGIPTHEQQAILLSAFIVLGIAPGPSMLSSHLDVVFTVIWIIVLASVVVGMIGLLTGKHLARLSTLPANVLVPLILTVGIVGTFAINGRIGDSITGIVFGIVGYLCFKYNYSRVNLIIGLVLGPILESNLHISTQLYGNDFLLHRPLAFALALIVVATIVYWIVRGRRNKGDRVATPNELTGAGAAGWGSVATAGAFVIVFAVAAVIGLQYKPLTGRILVGVSLICLVLSLINLPLVAGREHRRKHPRPQPEPRFAPDPVPNPDFVLASTRARTNSVERDNATNGVLGPSAPEGGAPGNVDFLVRQRAAPAEAKRGPGLGRNVLGLALGRRDRRERRAEGDAVLELRGVATVVLFLVSTLLFGLVVGPGLAVLVYRLVNTSARTLKTYCLAVVAGVITATVVAILLNTLVNEYIPYEGIFTYTSFYIGA